MVHHHQKREKSTPHYPKIAGITRVIKMGNTTSDSDRFEVLENQVQSHGILSPVKDRDHLNQKINDQDEIIT
jgi:hypothetical protein